MSKLYKISSEIYKNLPNPTIIYGETTTKYGNCLMALYLNKICYLSFDNNKPELHNLKKIWPNSTLIKNNNKITEIYQQSLTNPQNIKLVVKGTNFQMDIWEMLLKTKKCTSYSDIARKIGRKDSVRAVGNAIGRNPIALLIPCHRVIGKNGCLGGYRWGKLRKLHILKDEGLL